MRTISQSNEGFKSLRRIKKVVTIAVRIPGKQNNVNRRTLYYESVLTNSIEQNRFKY